MPHLNVNGARLWYETLGQGQPILLHHGYTASRDNWLPVAELLASQYEVTLMECRGCGESEHTEDGYTLAQYALDAVALMGQLGHDQFTFGGHSMGGGVGMQIAIFHPQHLNGLILLGSVGSKGLIGDSFRANVEARLEARRNHDRQFFIDEQRAGVFRPEVQTDAWMNLRVHHLMDVVSDGHIIESMKSMQSMNFEAALSSITTPVLVIAGGVDPLLKANLQDYLRLSDASLQVFSRAAHEIAIHETAGVADTIRLFMEHGAISAEILTAREYKARE